MPILEGDDDEPLKAVLLADSFCSGLHPPTLERPAVLLPLLGVPMLEYALEVLECAGVGETLVISCRNTDEVRRYINASTWTKPAPPASTSHERRPGKASAGGSGAGGATAMVVSLVPAPDATSAGDALRIVFERNLIQSETFVLISGAIISNMNLKRIVQLHKEVSNLAAYDIAVTFTHKEATSIPFVVFLVDRGDRPVHPPCPAPSWPQRQSKDSNTVLTSVFKVASPARSALRTLSDDLVVALNQETGQYIMYNNEPASDDLLLSSSAFARHPKLQIR